MLSLKIKEFFYKLSTDKKNSPLLFLLKIFLLLLSFFYYIVIKILFFLQTSAKEKFKAKIISVGNITWGGTGKTPLVEIVSKYLKEKGLSVAVVTRGYGENKRQNIISDEVMILSRKLKGIPVIVNANKRKGIKEAEKKYNANFVVLDDGFQEWNINKDLEILVMDSANPFGNHRLIPRGILREPISSLKRADIFVLNKIDLIRDKESLYKLKEIFKKINPRAYLFDAFYLPVTLRNLISQKEESLELLKGKEVCIFSGIASPDSFKITMEKLGGKINLIFEFLDHYPYRESDLIKICSLCERRGIKILVTTEKDEVRINPFIKKIKERFTQLDIFSLIVELKILAIEEFYVRISSLFNN
ncbi:MAG: tetraacyldisaccharide 4'-kinase [Candidatus Omnitrophica bacterium]|nr:tetraacyldisaccharide 4'-kinase [Candidatus Omnitrophota bacterium]